MDSAAIVGELLTHYGVKGMHWGIRRSRPTTTVTVTQKGKRLKVEGGQGLPASSDAVKARVAAQKFKKSGQASLTNEEMQALVTRMNLEQQASRLAKGNSPYQKVIKGNEAVKAVLGVAGTVNSAIALANSPSGRMVAKHLRAMSK